jgi:acyl carrier protein
VTSAKETLQNVFRKVFADPSIVIENHMSAKDFEEWDSLQHINLIVATEKAFGIRFSTAEIARLKQPGQNIGTMLQYIESQIHA